jgi:hypothetical protein
VEVIAAVFVAGGVAGEFWYEMKIGVVDSCIQQADNARASVLETKASGLDAKAATLNKEAAGLQKQAEDERLARVKIEATVSWRSLSASQKKQIADELRAKVTGQTVEISADMGDMEAESFADDMADCLRAAGITVAPMTVAMRMPLPTTEGTLVTEVGVKVQPSGDGDTRILAAAIRDELNSRGFDAAEPSRTYGTEALRIAIFVAARPRGPQGEWKLAAQQPKR